MGHVMDESTLLIIGLATELIFLVFGIGAAWAVMSWRVKNLEMLVNTHLAGADNVKEDITKIKVWLRMLLKNAGIEVDDDL